MTDLPPVERKKELPADPPLPAAAAAPPVVKPKPGSKPDAKSKPAREPFPRWKKVLLGAASALFLLGLLLRLTSGPETGPQTAPSPWEYRGWCRL